MNPRTTIADRAALLTREVDELLLQLRGLVLVRDLLAERGASSAELDAHTAELERVRRRLTEMIGGGRSGMLEAAVS